tara:strand:- start:419 stop:769 length:351 start_codon:yes stop_codon:yes gene_type:complete
MADRDLTKVVAANDYAGTGRTVSAQSIATVQGVASYATGGFTVDWTDIGLTAAKVQDVTVIALGTDATDPVAVDRYALYQGSTDKILVGVASTGAELSAATDDSANYYKLIVAATE